RLQLLGSKQKFRDRLGRSDLQGIHQKSHGEDSGHQNDVSGDQGREGSRRFVELPRAVRTGRQEEMSNSALDSISSSSPWRTGSRSTTMPSASLAMKRPWNRSL